MTPKQRQMRASVEEIDTVRTWGKNSKNLDTATGKLPVRSMKGSWKDQKRLEEERLVEEDVSLSEDESTPHTKKKRLVVKSVDVLKQEIANMASLLTEKPEQNMKKLGELRQLCDPNRHKDRADGSDIVQLALVSTLAVMQDLMPGYSIRALSEEEKEAMVSKEVKTVRAFEQSYFSHYRGFLQRLQRLIQHNEDENVKFVAVACVCALLQSANHFNLYEDIVKLVAHGMMGSAKRTSEECCTAVETALKDDQHGKSTFLIIRHLSDLIKDRDYQASPKALATLLNARIRTDIAGHMPNVSVVKAPRSKKNLSKRETKEARKRLVELQKISDAEALVSKEEQERWYSESLRYLFRIYFGIIKKTRVDGPVIQQVLQGLAQFAHLIAQDTYFADLLRALKALTEGDNSDSLSLPAALQCVLTVARIQAIQEKTMSLDIKFIYNFLFKQLGRMSSVSFERDSSMKLLREVFKSLLSSRLHLPCTRLAAFAHRLVDLTGSLAKSSLDEFLVSDILTLLQGYMEEHKNVRAALLDPDCFGQGAYLPSCTDPDLCNPFAKSIVQPLKAIQANPCCTPRIKSLIGRILTMK